MSKYRDKFVLVDGMTPKLIEIVQSYGYKKVITLIELMVLHPHLC